MNDDERNCPNCGHDVISWDTMCPGCSQVPWETKVGARILKWRRRRQTWPIGFAILAAALVIGGGMLIGNMSLRRMISYEQTDRKLDRMERLVLRLLERGLAAEAADVAEERVAYAIEVYGENHPLVTHSLVSLLGIYIVAEDPDRIELTLDRLITLMDQSYGPHYPAVAETLTTYAARLRGIGRIDLGNLLDSRAADIRARW